MCNEEESYEIIAGPSLGDLVDALKYAYNKAHPIRVTFTIVEEPVMPGRTEATRICQVIKALIEGVTHTDDGGVNVSVEGYITESRAFPADEHFWAEYDAQKRKGHMWLPVMEA